jgi:polyhydroxyalkanoate synthesis regulator phasin
MDQKKIFKQMLDFNKSSFNNAFNAMVMVQDQTETMSSSLLEQATWLPEEGKKAIQDWIKACKKGREEYKRLVDDAYQKVENLF